MINVAVIGIGNMGKNHARIYSELGILAAVSDVNGELAKKIAEKHNCKAYTDYNEMLEKEHLDAVSIVVPTSLHKKVALDVIRKGINVLIEKPIADSIEAGEEIVNAAKAKGVKLMVGHIERFNPAVQRLKKMIDGGQLGKITSIVAKRVGVAPPQIKDANIIIDMAVHDIDVMNYLLGKDPEVAACIGGVALTNGREDHAEILLKYGEACGFVQVNWITPIKIRQLAVTGLKGYVELDYIKQKLVVYESNYEKEYDNFGDFIVKFGSPSIITIDLSNEEPLKNELKEFIRCIKENKEPEINGDKALAVLKTAIESLKRLREGK